MKPENRIRWILDNLFKGFYLAVYFFFNTVFYFRVYKSTE